MASKKTKRTELGQRLIAGLKEAVAHSRGEIALEGRVVEAMPPSRVKAIVRKAGAK